MRRVSDVLDCWFESGAMPFAQLHYPFENKAWFDDHFPADFICEYVGQTRGWFYTLHVLATALFDRPAFSNCLAHGNVLGDDGRKLSKRLQNFPDPEEFFGRAGSDTMRWFMLSSPVLRGLDVSMESEAMAEPIRRVLNPIWNSWYFLCLYGGTDKVTGSIRHDQRGLLDRYILAKSAALVDDVTNALDRYDISGATTSITSYLDALTNWYVRRSRDRFWRSFEEGESADSDKQDAYDTLHTVLELLCRVVAPLLPYLAEEVWRPLTGQRSVHLADWPDDDGTRARPRSRRLDGPRPRDLLSRPLDSKGERTTGPSPASKPHLRRCRDERAIGARGAHPRRGQRQGGALFRRRRGLLERTPQRHPVRHRTTPRCTHPRSHQRGQAR